MTDERVVVETLCEHGQTAPHDIGCGHNCGWTYGRGYRHGAHWWCPGGSRRTLTPGEYVLIEKVDGEWPDEVEQAVVNGLSAVWTHVGKDTRHYSELLPRARSILDALASVAGKDT